MPTKMRTESSEHTLFSRDASDVSPGSPLHDLLDRSVGHVVLGSQRSQRAATIGVSFADRDHVAVREMSGVVHGTSHHSTVTSRLPDILSLGSPAQMSRIDAGRVIAEMQDRSLVADRRAMRFVTHDAMCETRSCRVVGSHSSVAIRVACERPLNTLLGVRSENFQNVFSRLGRHTSKHTRGGQ